MRSILPYADSLGLQTYVHVYRFVAIENPEIVGDQPKPTGQLIMI